MRGEHSIFSSYEMSLMSQWMYLRLQISWDMVSNNVRSGACHETLEDALVSTWSSYSGWGVARGQYMSSRLTSRIRTSEPSSARHVMSFMWSVSFTLRYHFRYHLISQSHTRGFSEIAAENELLLHEMLLHLIDWEIRLTATKVSIEAVCHHNLL